MMNNAKLIIVMMLVSISTVRAADQTEIYQKAIVGFGCGFYAQEESDKQRLFLYGANAARQLLAVKDLNLDQFVDPDAYYLKAFPEMPEDFAIGVFAGRIMTREDNKLPQTKDFRTLGEYFEAYSAAKADIYQKHCTKL